MFGRYLVVEESSLKDTVKSPLGDGKGEWFIIMSFSIQVHDCNMLATSWVTMTLKM